MARNLLLESARRCAVTLTGREGMTGLGCFQTAVCGMSGQSHALDVIGANIANVTTGGYKRTDTGFRTLLSDTIAFHPGNPDAAGPASIQSDLGGMRRQRQRADQRGRRVCRDRPRSRHRRRGTRILHPEQRGRRLRRDRLRARWPARDVATGRRPEGYLVDKNGYFLQGWAAAPDGSFPTGARSPRCGSTPTPSPRRARRPPPRACR